MKIVGKSFSQMFTFFLNSGKFYSIGLPRKLMITIINDYQLIIHNWFVYPTYWIISSYITSETVRKSPHRSFWNFPKYRAHCIISSSSEPSLFNVALKYCSIGDVANSKCPLLIITKVQLRLRITRRSWQKFFVGKKFSDCADAVIQWTTVGVWN